MSITVFFVCNVSPIGFCDIRARGSSAVTKLYEEKMPCRLGIFIRFEKGLKLEKFKSQPRGKAPKYSTPSNLKIYFNFVGDQNSLNVFVHATTQTRIVRQGQTREGTFVLHTMAKY